MLKILKYLYIQAIICFQINIQNVKSKKEGKQTNNTLMCTNQFKSYYREEENSIDK